MQNVPEMRLTLESPRIHHAISLLIMGYTNISVKTIDSDVILCLAYAEVIISNGVKSDFVILWSKRKTNRYNP